MKKNEVRMKCCFDSFIIVLSKMNIQVFQLIATVISVLIDPQTAKEDFKGQKIEVTVEYQFNQVKMALLDLFQCEHSIRISLTSFLIWFGVQM